MKLNRINRIKTRAQMKTSNKNHIKTKMNITINSSIIIMVKNNMPKMMGTISMVKKPMPHTMRNIGNGNRNSQVDKIITTMAKKLLLIMKVTMLEVVTNTGRTKIRMLHQRKKKRVGKSFKVSIKGMKKILNLPLLRSMAM